MILIDALYINNGGGMVMLNYLISKLEQQNIDCFYLLDNRIPENAFKIKSTNRIFYSKASLLKRYFFYKKNKKNFKTVFCLANIPPNFRLNCKTITYFHSTLYIDLSVDNSFLDQTKIALKRFFLKRFLNNSDLWFVQTNLIKENFKGKFKIDEKKILVKPFFPVLGKTDNRFKKDPLTFLYVSIATAHKNHKRLIESFCKFYDKYKRGKLLLTVGEEFEDVLSLINNKLELGYPVENLGYIKRDNLIKYYELSEYFIFPSLTESFGLGLVEAIECNCKVIGADLAYTYAICEPSIVFDPLSVESITNAFEETLNNNVKVSKSYIVDMIDDVINFIK